MEIQEKHLMLVSYVKDFLPQLYEEMGNDYKWLLLLKKVTDFHKEKSSLDYLTFKKNLCLSGKKAFNLNDHKHG